MAWLLSYGEGPERGSGSNGSSSSSTGSSCSNLKNPTHHADIGLDHDKPPTRMQHPRRLTKKAGGVGQIDETHRASRCWRSCPPRKKLMRIGNDMKPRRPLHVQRDRFGQDISKIAGTSAHLQDRPRHQGVLDARLVVAIDRPQRRFAVPARVVLLDLPWLFRKIRQLNVSPGAVLMTQCALSGARYSQKSPIGGSQTILQEILGAQPRARILSALINLRGGPSFLERS